jgi:N utilization substance protein A
MPLISFYKNLISIIKNYFFLKVHQILRKEVILLDEEGVEMVLPKSEQIFSDFFRKGDSVRAVISAVEVKNNTIQVMLSRVSNNFLERLFESEIPEVFDGLIIVKDIAREPGVKAKVSVESYDDRVDPVGICVGIKGSRIQSIVRELNNEYIDIVNYTTNKSLYVMRALGQGKADIEMNDDKKVANVVILQSELAKAIGKAGLNIKLASKLTGYKINVYSDQEALEEDVSLDDFSDEIDGWIIDELEKIGCDTAKSVLKMSFKDLVEKTDLEEETIREVLNILEAEFK